MDKMINRILTSLLVFMIMIDFCWGQAALPPQIRLRQTMDAMTDAGGLTKSDILYGIDAEPGRLLGDYYLDSKWNPAAILMYGSSKMIEGHYAKYDIEGGALELMVNNQIKMIPIRRIESFVWFDSLTQTPHAFVNAKGYMEKGVEMSGLLEVVEDGQIPLMKRTTIYIKQPSYVPAFDVGKKDIEIKKRDAFYYAKGKELTAIKKKKDLFLIFGDKMADMESYAETNHLKVKDESDLARLFEYYNSQFPDAVE